MPGLSVTILWGYTEACIRAFCGAGLEVFEEGRNGGEGTSSGGKASEANGSPGTGALKLSAGFPWLSGLDWVSLCSFPRRGRRQKRQRYRGLLRKVVRALGGVGRS